MTAKESINSFLARTTGYHLTKGVPGAGAGAKPPAPARPRKARAAAPSFQFPLDYDEDVRQVIRDVRGWTMTKTDKLHALVTSVRYIVQHDIPGDIVECGVWRGGSMQAVARTLTKLGDQSRELYLFDTFEGMTEAGPEDVRHDGAAAESLLAQDTGRRGSTWAVASLEDVKDGFSRVDYPGERIHYVQGRVEDTVPAEAPERISILRLDTDWYASTKHELDHLYERLVPGGVLMIDDYGFWKGSRQATDEFIERTGAKLLLLRMNTGRVAVKPL